MKNDLTGGDVNALNCYSSQKGIIKKCNSACLVALSGQMGKNLK